MRLQLDRTTRLLAGGAIVVGGRPARMLRLTPAGARLVTAWRDGGMVSDQPAAAGLARRLTDTGLGHPVPDGGQWSTDDVAVVIAARDRAELLAGCLAGVGPAAELLVVDDGSSDSQAVCATARAAGARVLRRAVATGPAGARNAGLIATSAALVAFVDSDARPRAGWLEPLLGHFEDASTAAVAPRITVPAGRGARAAYEAVRSPLDMGRRPGSVGPGHPISFVPGTALVARRAALKEVGGFDAALRFGEDVDLVWRLARAGWSVRYEPAAVVEHPQRGSAGAWLGQRIAYGSSAGPLDRRHPGRLRHVVVPVWALAPGVLVVAGCPRSAVLASGCATMVLAVRLPGVPGARRQILALAAGANLRLTQQILDAAWRAYPPLMLAAALHSRRARWVTGLALATSIIVDWVQRRPRLDPLRFAALRCADDLAYATGVWLGCGRARTVGPLTPRLTRIRRLR